jgi:hypothetical protein
VTILAVLFQLIGVGLVVAGATVLFGLGGAFVAGGAWLFGVGFALEARSNA